MAVQMTPQVGDYKIFLDQFLGRGSFGIVYNGKHTRTQPGDEVAIKVVFLPLNRAEKARKNIDTELNILQSVHSDKIIKLLHHEFSEKSLSMVLEKCDFDLQEFACAEAEFEGLKLRFFHDTAEGVKCLHHHDIIHRDIKPENILVKKESGTWKIKLSDFGLSRRTPGDGSSSFSATGNIGTMGWMAPEVFTSTLDERTMYSKAADRFSLGVLGLSVIDHKPGQGLCPITVRNQSLGQWMHELQILDQEIHLPVLDRDGDNATVKSLKRLIERMIQPRASGRCKMQEVLDEITRIRKIEERRTREDLYVDKDVWKYIQACKKDVLDGIKKQAKVQLIATEREKDLYQVNIVVAQGVSDTTLAHAELEQLINQTVLEVRCELVTLPSADKHKQDLIQMVEEIPDLIVYQKENELHTFVFVGGKKQIKDIKGKVRKRIGYLPFIPKSEATASEDSEHSLDKEHTPSEDVAVCSGFYLKDENAGRDSVPKASERAKPQQKSIKTDPDEMDELFPESKQRTSAVIPRIPQCKDTPAVDRAVMKDSLSPEEKEILIAQLIEEGGSDAEEKINALLEPPRRQGTRKPERPSLQQIKTASTKDQHVEPARKLKFAAQDTTEGSSGEDLDMSEGEEAKRVSRKPQEKAAAGPRENLDTSMQEFVGDKKKVERAVKEPLRDVEKKDDFDVLFEEHTEGLRRVKLQNNDSDADEDEDDKPEKINHHTWLKIVDKAHPGHQREKRKEVTVTIKRETGVTEINMEHRDHEDRTEKRHQIPHSNTPSKIAQDRYTTGSKKTTNEKSAAETKLMVSYDRPLSSKSSAHEMGEDRIAMEKDTQAEEVHLKCDESDEEYNGWLSMLRDGIVTKQDFDNWIASRKENKVPPESERYSSIHSIKPQPKSLNLLGSESLSAEDVKEEKKRTSRSESPSLSALTSHPIASEIKPVSLQGNTTRPNTSGISSSSSRISTSETKPFSSGVDTSPRTSTVRSMQGSEASQETPLPDVYTAPSRTKPLEAVLARQNVQMQAEDTTAARDGGFRQAKFLAQFSKRGGLPEGEHKEEDEHGYEHEETLEHREQHETATNENSKAAQGNKRSSNPSPSSFPAEHNVLQRSLHPSLQCGPENSIPQRSMNLASAPDPAEHNAPQHPSSLRSSEGPATLEHHAPETESPSRKPGSQPHDSKFGADRVKNAPLPGHDENCHYEVTIEVPQMKAKFQFFFPGSTEGRNVLDLVKQVYDKKLLFKVEEGRVVWNAFTPKLEKEGESGYPDPGYLQEAKEQLMRILRSN